MKLKVKYCERSLWIMALNWKMSGQLPDSGLISGLRRNLISFRITNVIFTTASTRRYLAKDELVGVLSPVQEAIAGGPIAVT